MKKVAAVAVAMASMTKNEKLKLKSNEFKTVFNIVLNAGTE